MSYVDLANGLYDDPADTSVPDQSGTTGASSDGTVGEQAARNYLAWAAPDAVDSFAVPEEWISGLVNPRADPVSVSQEASRAAAADPTKSIVQGDQQDQPSLLDKILKFGRDNKSNPILAAALAGVAAVGKNDFTREQAATQQGYALQRADHDAQIARDKIAANSASVSGITPTKGIIAQRLARLNGAPVFGPTGRVL